MPAEKTKKDFLEVFTRKRGLYRAEARGRSYRKKSNECQYFIITEKYQEIPVILKMPLCRKVSRNTGYC